MPIHETKQGWVLETRATGYAFGLNKAGLLTHRYWGVRLPQPDDYPAPANPLGWASFNNPAQLTLEEYPGYEDAKYSEPCFKATFADGVRDVVLRFESAEVQPGDTPELHLHLRDTVYPLRVTLHYRIHEAYDLIERWVIATNTGDQPIMLERIWSAQWHLPLGETYRLTHATGRWLDETHLRRELLLEGAKVLESRRITTSHHHQPWFALDRGHATEDAGDVWFGVLAWSGNWKLAAEVTEFWLHAGRHRLERLGLRMAAGTAARRFDTPSQHCWLHAGWFRQRQPPPSRFHPRHDVAARACHSQGAVQLMGSYDV